MPGSVRITKAIATQAPQRVISVPFEVQMQVERRRPVCALSLVAEI